MNLIKLLTIPAVALFVGVAHADGSGPFEGSWMNVIVTDGGLVGKKCRYIDIETRRYELGRTPDGDAAGSYARQHMRDWIIKVDPSCQMPESKTLPDGFMRADHWSVHGHIDDNEHLHLSGTHLECMGDCQSEVATTDRFTAKLHLLEGRVIDVRDGSADQTLVFSRAADHEQGARDADAAFTELLRPFRNGNCSLFYENSLDPGSRSLLPMRQDVFCAALTPMAQLLGQLTLNKPMYSYLATVGTILPGAAVSGQQHYLLSMDAVVQHMLSATSGEGGIPVTALLRRQPNGRWKIRTLL